MDSVTITRQDLKNAIDQCEFRCGEFDIDDVWDALANPQPMAEIIPVDEAANGSFFRLLDYNVTRFPEIDGMVQVMIRRTDRKPIHNWHDLMAIKDKVVGEESEAVELYPARSRLVDEDHIYHLYAKPNRIRFNFGMQR
jgi:hypothetical protein